MEKKREMKTLFTIIFIYLFVSSCGSHYRRPESIQEKMTRYKSKANDLNHVPRYFPTSEKLLSQKSRMPASLGKRLDKSLSYNNNKFYFLTLFRQYKTLQRYSQYSLPNIRICPNFHTTFLNYKNKYKKTFVTNKNHIKFTYSINQLNDKHFLAAHPELALPLTQDNIYPRVKDIIIQKKNMANQTIHKALNIHISKTYKEIKELCEYGQSKNYYIFENLMAYINQQKTFQASKDNLDSLMKTTLFSNMALIKSIQRFDSKIKNNKSSRTIASLPGKNQEDIFSHEIIRRLRAPWSYHYLENIR